MTGQSWTFHYVGSSLLFGIVFKDIFPGCYWASEKFKHFYRKKTLTNEIVIIANYTALDTRIHPKLSKDSVVRFPI